MRPLVRWLVVVCGLHLASVPAAEALEESAAQGNAIKRVVVEGSVETAIGLADESIGLVEAQIMERGVSIQLSAPFIAVRSADGLFRFDIECHFVGDGELLVWDPTSLEQDPVARIPLSCVPRQDSGISADDPGPGRFEVLALTDAAPPQMLPGEIVAWELTTRTDKVSSVDTSSGTRSDMSTEIFASTLSAGELCSRRELRDCERCQSGTCQNLCCDGPARCSSPFVSESCFSPTADQVARWEFSIDSSSFVRDEPGRTADSQERTTFHIEFEFPLPSGVQIGTVLVFATREGASNVSYTGPLESQEMTLNGGLSTSIPMEKGFVEASGPCIRRIDSERLVWEFPVTVPGNRVTLSMAPEPTCVLSPQSMRTFLTSSFKSRAVEGGEVMLGLEPENGFVAPSSRLVGFAGCAEIPDAGLFGASSTKVRAILSDAPPSSPFTVEMEVSAFSASATGHAHGAVPPQDLWGTIGGADQASCSLITDSDGKGFCDLVYQSERVSGEVTLRATVSELSELDPVSTDISVEIGGLARLGPAANGTYHLTGDTSNHPENHFGTANAVSSIQTVARTYASLTGLALGINDMSLIRGGIFDVAGGWGPSHCSHRHGVDADIDRTRFDLNGDPVVTVDCSLDLELLIAAQSAGAQLYCESGGRKHLDLL